MKYETSYVIVAGVAWIRRSRVEMSAGRVDDSVWLVTFDGDGVHAYKDEAGDSTITRGRAGGIDWELDWVELVGPFVVDAPEESFFGLRYPDTDGSQLWCYHSEHAHLRGGDVDFDGAAMEIATREPILGRPVLA
jgi:hypothetical protein